jgi:hypothetical protein
VNTVSEHKIKRGRETISGLIQQTPALDVRRQEMDFMNLKETNTRLITNPACSCGLWKLGLGR